MNESQAINPVVSVVVPCYNHESYIVECINSIISQSYENIELIVIDDGSKDGSVKLIKNLVERCKQRFVRFEFRHRANKGACATLNEGIEWCTGDYFILLASDDSLSKDRVSRQVQILDGKNDILAIFGSFNEIDHDSNILRTKLVKESVFGYRDILLNKAALNAPTMMIKAHAFRSILPIPEDVVIEDRYIQLALTKKYGDCLLQVPDVFVLYRRHENNVSNNIDRLFDKNIELISMFTDGDLREKAIAKNLVGYAISMAYKDKVKAIMALLKAVKYDFTVLFDIKCLHAFFNLMFRWK